MPNMKQISIITIILMVSVALLHNITIFTKLIVGFALVAGWAFFAVVRSARERRRARQSGE